MNDVSILVDEDPYIYDYELNMLKKDRDQDDIDNSSNK